MKLTTLDVLIVTSLAQQARKRFVFRPQNPTVELSKTIFEVHSQFVKASDLFTKRNEGQRVIISLAKYIGPSTFPVESDPIRKEFFQKCSYWRTRYKQDCLLPFEESGFSALRLADNAEFFSLTLFRQGALWWDLKADKCYVGSKQLAGSGLQWALDWFAVSWIARRECGLEWQDFGPRLDSIHAPHKIGLQFTAKVSTLPHLSGGQHKLYCALKEQLDRKIECGPLLLVSGSQHIVLKEHPKVSLHLSEYSKRLLWLVCTTPDMNEKIPIKTAFEWVTGRKKPKENNIIRTDNTASSIERKQKTLENARDKYWKEITQIADDYEIEEAPYISIDEEGVWIVPKKL